MSGELQFSNYSIKDKNLMGIAVDFANRWKKVQYLIETHDYIPSNFNTFCVAQALVKQGRENGAYPSLKETPNLDSHSFAQISELTRTNKITYLAMDYPPLANFKCFYFKERNEDVGKIVEDTLGATYSTRIGSHSIHEVLDALNQARLMTTDEHKQDLLEDEIELMSGVCEFIRSCEEKAEQVGRIFTKHHAKLEREMNINRRKMVAIDYEQWKKEKVSEVASLGDRYDHVIAMLIGQFQN